MPRKQILTFQKGANGRAGRWKKCYLGKTYYLGAGNCKSDIKSYRKSLAQWELKKKEIDAATAAASKPHDADYKFVIDEWERVLSWAVEHDDTDAAEEARHRLVELGQRREQSNQPPIVYGDAHSDRFRPAPEALQRINDAADAAIKARPFAAPDWGVRLIESAKNSVAMPHKSAVPLEIGNCLPVNACRPFFHPSGIDPLAELEIRWRDRLENRTTSEAEEENDSVGYWVDQLIDKRRIRVAAGELSVGQQKAAETALKAFRDWLGTSTSVHAINSRSLSEFHSEQLELIDKGTYKANYVRDRMSVARSFVRWLWEQEVIEDLPRNLDSRDLRVARHVGTPVVFEISEIQSLIRRAPSKTRLYILLALNTGMTQKDIADLRHDTIDWDNGRLTRKRSKTKRFENVPTVTYKLWPEVIELLRQHRSEGDRVLTNENGDPLHQEYIGSDDKLKKNDNIKNAFDRVLRKTKITKSFGKIRKTSASLIENDPRYRGLDELFLGQAPSSIAKRHYVLTSESALDDALDFLRSEYRIDKLDEDDDQATESASPHEAAENSAA